MIELYGSADEDWRTFANCQGMVTELFFPPEETDGRKLPKDFYEPAKQVCGLCPVRFSCLEQGMEEEYGVWGGLTKAERKHLRRARTLRLPIQRTSSDTRTNLATWDTA